MPIIKKNDSIDEKKEIYKEKVQKIKITTCGISVVGHTFPCYLLYCNDIDIHLDI